MVEPGFTIAAAQSSSDKGDLYTNIRRHRDIVTCASDHGADAVVFPELSLTGYEPGVAGKLAACSEDTELVPLRELSDRLEVMVIVGCPIRSGGSRPFIGAFVFQPGREVVTYRKRFLHPGEEEHFVPSEDNVVCGFCGRGIGIAICADINNARHPSDAKREGAKIYAAGVAMTPKGIGEAENNMASYARRHRMLAVMANYASPTGGFEMAGRSAIWNENGEVIARAGAEGEALVLAEETGGAWAGRAVPL